jgi:hypothetical protein
MSKHRMFKTIGNQTKIFYRLFYCNKDWSDKLFDFHYVPAQLGGVLYAGITLFKHSIVYSSEY